MTDVKRYTTGSFWLGLVDRAVKTFVQVLTGLWIADEGFNIITSDLGDSASVALTATVLSVLTSFISMPVGETGTTSFLPGGR